VLGAESGYAPGPHYTAAVDRPSEWLLELRANGVGVSASRNVFAPLQGEVGPVVCPHCGQVVELEDAATAQLCAQWKPFRDAIKAWLAGGADEVACPACGQVAGFNDWRWVSDWPFAVGFLGFTFWNWPKLNEPFIAQVTSHLRHRVVSCLNEHEAAPYS